MKYFVTLNEDLLLKLWILDPTSVIPFSRAYMEHQALNNTEARMEKEVKSIESKTASIKSEKVVIKQDGA